MKNYYDFKKNINSKLERILEDKITRLVLPRNAFGYTGNNASYTVSPFGVKEYLITVIFESLEVYNTFMEEFYKVKNQDLFSAINWKRDGVYGFYGVDLYVNRDRLEEAQSFIKNLLHNI